MLFRSGEVGGAEHGVVALERGGERFADAVATVAAAGSLVAVGVNCTDPRHVAALLADAEAAVLAQWRQPLWLTVNAGNGSAIRFYQRQGFAIVGEDHFELEGARHLNWVMSRPQG